MNRVLSCFYDGSAPPLKVAPYYTPARALTLSYF
jgi:hypothetical protein